MMRFRLLLIAAAVAATVLYPFLNGSYTSSSARPSVYASSRNANNDRNRNENHNKNENKNQNRNENQSIETKSTAATATAAVTQAKPCQKAGQDSLVKVGDGRIAIHVFPTMPQDVSVSARMPVDPSTVPPLPGPLVGGLLFELQADNCAGAVIATLRAEVNMSISFTDIDAAGQNKANFKLYLLDPTDNANPWKLVEKQVTDAANNAVGATITKTGFYALLAR